MRICIFPDFSSSVNPEDNLDNDALECIEQTDLQFGDESDTPSSNCANILKESVIKSSLSY